MSGRIYTKQGDKGKTTLFGGSSVSKGDLRLEAYGTFDELNAAIGLACSFIAGRASALETELRAEQNYLFTLGSHLACADAKLESKLPPLDAKQIDRLEAQIDAWQSQLAPLTQFILPGGDSGAAALHLARTICRRAERQVVRFQDQVNIDPHFVMYLNRLGDYLFVAARAANLKTGTSDVTWVKNRA